MLQRTISVLKFPLTHIGMPNTNRSAPTPGLPRALSGVLAHGFAKSFAGSDRDAETLQVELSSS